MRQPFRDCSVAKREGFPAGSRQHELHEGRPWFRTGSRSEALDHPSERLACRVDIADTPTMSERSIPAFEPSLLFQKQTAATEHGAIFRREDQAPELVIGEQAEKHNDRHRI